MQSFLESLQPTQQQWKFVIRNEADMCILQKLLTHFPLFHEQQLPIVLQPEGDLATSDYPTALEHLAEQVRDPFWGQYYVRVLPQLHVIIWGRKKLV